MSYYSCEKCQAPYHHKVVSSSWYHDRRCNTWYCPSCVREACRDARKELEALTNKSFCSFRVYGEAKKQYTEEFWKVLRKQMPSDVEDIDMHDLWSQFYFWNRMSQKVQVHTSMVIVIITSTQSMVSIIIVISITTICEDPSTATRRRVIFFL